MSCQHTEKAQIGAIQVREFLAKKAQDDEISRLHKLQNPEFVEPEPVHEPVGEATPIGKRRVGRPRKDAMPPPSKKAAAEKKKMLEEEAERCICCGKLIILMSLDLTP